MRTQRGQFGGMEIALSIIVVTLIALNTLFMQRRTLKTLKTLTKVSKRVEGRYGAELSARYLQIRQAEGKGPLGSPDSTGRYSTPLQVQYHFSNPTTPVAYNAISYVDGTRVDVSQTDPLEGSRQFYSHGIAGSLKYIERADSSLCGNMSVFEGDSGSQICLVSSAPAIPPPTVHLEINNSTAPPPFAYNAVLNIAWSSEGANSCDLQPYNLNGTSATFSAQATQSQTVSLTCSGPGGEASVEIEIVVNPPPTPSVNLLVIGADGVPKKSTEIDSGTTVTARWDSSGTSHCQLHGIINQPVQPVPTTADAYVLGPFEHRHPDTMNLRILCHGLQAGQYAQDTASVRIRPKEATADLKVNASDGPVTVVEGETVTLSWTSQNTLRCRISGYSSSFIGKSGSVTHQPTRAVSLYSLWCQSFGEPATDSVVITVKTMEELCVEKGATWGISNKICADWCVPVGTVCTSEVKVDCDCGAGRCWDRKGSASACIAGGTD